MSPVLFRVDAGFGIGLGHLNRCLSLASALRETGRDCVFLTSAEPAAQLRVEALGFVACSLDDVELGGPCDWQLTRSAANACDGDMVVVDSYHVGADFLRRLRDAGLLVVAIDDVADFTFPCQLVINGGICAESLPYRSSTRDTRFLLGARYAMLRPEFWRCRPRTSGRQVREVVVTMGGADGLNLTPLVLEVLDALPSDFGVTVIIGPFFKNRSEIEAVAERSRRSVNVVMDPDSISDLMLAAGLVVSAGGQTLFELATTGAPSVAVQVAENQSRNLSEFSRHGVVSPVFATSPAQLRNELEDKLRLLLSNPELRQQMSTAGRDLVDGGGALRCARIMVELDPVEGLVN